MHNHKDPLLNEMYRLETILSLFDQLNPETLSKPIIGGGQNNINRSVMPKQSSPSLSQIINGMRIKLEEEKIQNPNKYNPIMQTFEGSIITADGSLGSVPKYNMRGGSHDLYNELYGKIKSGLYRKKLNIDDACDKKIRDHIALITELGGLICKYVKRINDNKDAQNINVLLANYNKVVNKYTDEQIYTLGILGKLASTI